VRLEVPYACTITGVTLLGDQAGTVSLRVYRTTYAAYDGDPTDDSPTALISGTLGLTSAVKYFVARPRCPM
jgi:hypothetical protein